MFVVSKVYRMGRFYCDIINAADSCRVYYSFDGVDDVTFANANKKVRKLNRGNLPRFEVRYERMIGTFVSYYCIFDMWHPFLEDGEFVATHNYAFKENADKVCFSMNTSDQQMAAWLELHELVSVVS